MQWKFDQGLGGFTCGMANWLLAIAPHLESLSVDLGRAHDGGYLPQALMGIRHSPKLREAHIGGNAPEWGPIFFSLSYLSQVTTDLC